MNTLLVVERAAVVVSALTIMRRMLLTPPPVLPIRLGPDVLINGSFENTTQSPFPASGVQSVTPNSNDVA